MYSIALVAITAAAAYKGDLREGMIWLSQPGTYDEISMDPSHPRTWSVFGKISCLVLFSSMGFFGSSCSAAITKQFGALTMSITSTARKAMTLFLSFFFFNNVCTPEHLTGVIIFIAALTAKSLRRRGKKHKPMTPHQKRRQARQKRMEKFLQQQQQEADEGIPVQVIRSPKNSSTNGDFDGLVRRVPSTEGGQTPSTSFEVAGIGYRRDAHIV